MMTGAVEDVEYSRKMSARGHRDWTFVIGKASTGAIARAQTSEEGRDSPGVPSTRHWYSTCTYDGVHICQTAGFGARGHSARGGRRGPGASTFQTRPRQRRRCDE